MYNIKAALPPPITNTNNQLVNKSTTITVAKGIAIILMVTAHTMTPLGAFIYAFHIPLFFLTAGYCFKTKYCNDRKTFIRHRIKGLWWPFLKWNLIFIILHNVLFSIGIYESAYTAKDMATQALKSVFMTGAEQMLGGYWFLGGLFLASILSLIILTVTRCRAKLLVGCLIVLIVACMTLNTLFPETKAINDGSSILFFTAFFLSGFLLKTFRDINIIPASRHLHFGILMLIATWLISTWISGDMRTPYGWQLPIRYIGAIAGCIGLLILCKHLPPASRLARFFKFCGESTMTILTWHFLCFKGITYVLIQIHDLPADKLQEFPTLRELGPHYWLLYTIAGIAIPLLLQLSYNTIKNKVKQLKSSESIAT